MLFIAIQLCAFVWYALSYIPYGQAMLARLLPWGAADSAAGG